MTVRAVILGAIAMVAAASVQSPADALQCYTGRDLAFSYDDPPAGHPAIETWLVIDGQSAGVVERLPGEVLVFDTYLSAVGDSTVLDWWDLFTSTRYAFVTSSRGLDGQASGLTDNVSRGDGSWSRPLRGDARPCPAWVEEQWRNPFQRSWRSLLRGRWAVAAQHQPGISAMSTAEADAWIGTDVWFSAFEVQFGESRCEAPDYMAVRILDSRIHEYPAFPLRELGIEADSVPAFAISCGFQDWIAPGSLVGFYDDRLFTTWDGVFFELHRATEGGGGYHF